MCDVCKVMGQDYKFLCGRKARICRASLFQVLVGKVAELKLCYLHDIELFHLGERRFMMRHARIGPVVRAQR